MSTGNIDSQIAGRARSRTGLTLIEMVVIVIIIVLLVALLLPSMNGGGAAPRSMCKNNLKQIGLALHNYHDAYGSFPPAFVVGDNGRPLYSWRVLILPFLDRQSLYDALRLDEPWDSPHNRPLLDVDLDVYFCPSDKKFADESDEPEAKGMTNYLAVVGPETVWPSPGVCRLKDISDGTSNTILVVEIVNSGIHWAEPRDLHVTQMSREVNPQAGMGLSSRHEGGSQVLLADGSTRFIADAMPRETLRALLTPAGAETIGDDF